MLQDLLESSTKICVDPGFSVNEAENSSVIGYEYISQIRHVLTSWNVLVILLGRGQVRLVPADVHADTRVRINSLVMNTRDRQFLKVTFNSHEKVLASHDFNDFSHPTRQTIRDDLECTVATAGEVVGIMAD